MRRLRGSRRRGRRRARVAVDATGLAQGAVSTFFSATHASSRAETVAVAALAEVGGRSRFGSTVCLVADRATRPMSFDSGAGTQPKWSC